MADIIFELTVSQMTTTSQLFIVGHERSGTSLVRAVLAAHPDFYIAPNDADPLLLLEGASRKRQCNADNLDILSTDPKLKAWDIDWQGVKTAIAGRELSCSQVYKIILEEFWKNSAAKWKAIKRPKYERRIDLLKGLFPECRIIALIRDPRAVLSSKKYYGGEVGKYWKIAGFLHVRLVTSILRWRSSVALIRQAEQRYGSDMVYVVRYEDIIENPARFLRRLFAFLDTEYSEEDVLKGIRSSFNSNSSFLDESTEQSVFRKDTLDRWKEKLEPGEQEIINFALQQYLEREGYDTGDAGADEKRGNICRLNCMMMRMLALTGKY
jgi:hypothetical protein